jgi:hypothetical protein
MLRWFDALRAEPPIDPKDRLVYSETGELLFTINLVRGEVVFPQKNGDRNAK